MQCAAYVKNQTVSRVSNVTPFELWFKRPNISHLKVFDCLVFVHVPDEKRGKLVPKAVEVMMVGYVEGSISSYQVCFFFVVRVIQHLCQNLHYFEIYLNRYVTQEQERTTSRDVKF